MFDKQLCKNIDKKHITVGDAIGWALPEILMCGITVAIVISYIVSTILIFGAKVAVFIFVGMAVFISVTIFILNIEIANCPTKEEDE